MLLLTLALLAGPADSAGVRDIEVAPGETLHTTTVGAGPPVVLIPGLFGAAFGYRAIVQPLVARGYRCIVVEPLGYAWSSHPKKADYSFTAQALRVGAVVDSLGVTRALFVAQSSAVSIALRLAVARPGLVRGVLAIDGGPSESAATPGMKEAFKLGGFAVKLALDESKLRHDVRREIVRNSGDTTWVTDEVIRQYTAGQAADMHGSIDAFQQMSKAKESGALADRLSQYDGPVRLLVGTVPHPAEVSDEQQEVLRERLPDFRSDSVRGSGQYINEEQPAVVVAAVTGLDEASR
ncbi:MAG TPA: alpha/beta hydrolase [Gemmatimonadales bacterium]|nr:alpha/beta hydrolase [Gemmatimonadales bacterium]